VLLPGSAPWSVADGSAGSQAGLYFADADGDGVFSAAADNLWVENVAPPAQYDAGDELLTPQWHPVSGMQGIATGLFYADTDGSLEYSDGEALWHDTGTVRAEASFDTGDHLILGPAPDPGTVGINLGIFYSDANGNGRYDEPEDIWTKARYSRFTTKAQELLRVTVEVAAGWNLVSVPILPIAIDVPLSVAPQHLTLWGWDPRNQRYESAELMEPRRGYWLQAESRGQITVVGYAVDNPAVYVTGPGWDLIGVIEPIRNLKLINLPVEGTSVPTDLYVPVSWWSAENQAYIAEDETQAFDLVPFRGYWIKAQAPAGTAGQFRVELQPWR
jgi:hypothetical protein